MVDPTDSTLHRFLCSHNQSEILRKSVTVLHWFGDDTSLILLSTRDDVSRGTRITYRLILVINTRKTTNMPPFFILAFLTDFTTVKDAYQSLRSGPSEVNFRPTPMHSAISAGIKRNHWMKESSNKTPVTIL